MAVNQAVRNQLARRAQEGPKSEKPDTTLRKYLQQMAPELKKALPRYMDAERLIRLANTQIRLTPELQLCSVQSVLGGVMQAAQLGLEPGVLGQCYLLPFKNRGKYEAVFVIGYRGLVELAHRSGKVASIEAHTVHENDEFRFRYGTNPGIDHVPVLQNRGNVVAAYAVATLHDGTRIFEVLNREEIDKVRSASPSGQSEKSPWHNWYEQMAEKTAIRRLAKQLPMAVVGEEFRVATQRDEQAVSLDEQAVSLEDALLDDGSIDTTGAVQEEPDEDVQPEPEPRDWLDEVVDLVAEGREPGVNLDEELVELNGFTVRFDDVDSLAAEAVMAGGKHEGKSINAVYDEDPSYVTNYLAAKFRNDRIRTLAGLYALMQQALEEAQLEQDVPDFGPEDVPGDGAGQGTLFDEEEEEVPF